MFKAMKIHLPYPDTIINLGYPSKSLVVFVTIIVGGSTAWLIVNQRYLLAVPIAILCLVIGLCNWRWSVYGLLIYLPFAGIPILAMYPSKTPLLYKDLFFVVPAYLGFVATCVFRHEPIRFSGTPVWLMGGFGALVLIQLTNPNLNNWLAGLIGVKVWLFYIPLYFLAYHFINTKEELIRLTKIVLLISLIPFLFGIVQAILIYGGYDYVVYQLYGDRAASVTQNFAQFNFPDGGFLRRLPSTFQFAAQYYGYVMSMLPLAAAMWMIKKGKLRIYLGVFLAILISLAGFMSGIRRAFLLIPVFWLLFSFFFGRLSNVTRSILITAIAVLLTLNILGAGLDTVYRPISALTVYYSRTTVSRDLIEAVKTAPLGLGTGMNTHPARHAFTNPSAFRWLSENYYAKVVYELGIGGLLILVVLFLGILMRGYSTYRVLQDPVLIVFSAAFLAYFAMIMIDSTKAQPLDIDPVNVYFWLFAGLLAKLTSLDAIHK